MIMGEFISLKYGRDNRLDARSPRLPLQSINVKAERQVSLVWNEVHKN